MSRQYETMWTVIIENMWTDKNVENMWTDENVDTGQTKMCGQTIRKYMGKQYETM